MTVPTGDIGNCYEYRTDGKRLASTDRLTIDGMIEYSRLWPETWHQYVGPNGYQTWAKSGREVKDTLPWVRAKQ